jgi:hypothetical protein
VRWSEITVYVTIVLALALWWVWVAASRLDRLHRKVGTSRAVLDAQLVRRATVAAELATSGLLDPVSSVLVGEAAWGALSTGTSELPADLRSSPSMGVEVDAMPGGFVCSASLKTARGNDEVLAVASGERPLRKLFSKEQRKFFSAHAPEGLELDELTLLGPIFVLKLKFRPADYDRRLVAELWNYPDNSRILELSTKCAPAEAFQVSLDSKAFLRERGVELSGEQQTKTKTALEYFSNSLSAAPS